MRSWYAIGPVSRLLQVVARLALHALYLGELASPKLALQHVGPGVTLDSEQQAADPVVGGNGAAAWAVRGGTAQKAA